MSASHKNNNQKKAKIDWEELCDTAWQHWQNYLENEEDVDELTELIELVQPHLTSDTSPCKDWTLVATRFDLLPYLISVAATALAEEAIAQYLAAATTEQQQQHDTSNDHLWKDICQQFSTACFPS